MSILTRKTVCVAVSAIPITKKVKHIKPTMIRIHTIIK